MLRCVSCVVKNLSYQTLKSANKVGVEHPMNKPDVCQMRKIHLTPRDFAIPPLLILVRPMKLVAILVGRTIRKRWQRLSPDDKKRILSKLRGRRSQITAGVTALTSLGILFYVKHLEENPITKRKRFILYDEKQMDDLAELQFKTEVEPFQTEIVPPNYRVHKRVVRVANKILEGNKMVPNISSKQWAVTVIDRQDIANAVVLSNGNIVVFTGILNVASNDDQLAVVLAHEIAHALLQHPAENVSKLVAVGVFLLLPIAVLWALLPDFAAIVSQFLSSALASIAIHLPFSRFIEQEADTVGLFLMAAACFDVREAPVFWGKMAEISIKEPFQWLSTHPPNETRQSELSEMLPTVLRLRSECSCPKLGKPSREQMHYIKPPKVDEPPS